MGGVRTALYNYLYAKQHGGDFIIRIEDTDSQRFVPGAEAYIIEALNWCGIIPDEGVDENGKVVETASEKHPHAPYRQSQRRGIYRKYAEELVEKGFAYYRTVIQDQYYLRTDWNSILRNSIYKLNVNAIYNLGTDVPNGNNDELKPLYYLDVEVTVNPWVLNTQNVDLK